MASHLLLVVIAAIALTIFAERRQVQAPLLLAAVGLAASFIPGLPEIELEPETLLSVVVPPLLYSAALDFSFFSFIRRIRSILNLGVLLVVATAIAVAVTVGLTLPGVSLPVALILGAVVAPPDAVSAVSIGGKLGLPRRLMTILKGESLINDAAALTLFTLAAAAATGRGNFIDNGVLYFLYAAAVGLLVGIGIGLVVHAIRRRLTNPTLISALAIIVPFAAYGLAEQWDASGVIAVVFAGFTLGHNATEIGFAGRIQEREVWRVVDALLEAFVFAYMGLQLRAVIADAEASGYDLVRLGWVAALLLVVVIAIRFAWVFATALVARILFDARTRRPPPSPRRGRRRHRPAPEPLAWRENLVLSWSGMRGVVTVAAATGAPAVTTLGEPIAGYAIVIPLAFAVAIGTLLLQGLTLPWLIRRANLSNSDDEAFRRQQLLYAREVQEQATIGALDEYRDTQDAGLAANLAESLLQSSRAATETVDPDLEDPEETRSERTLAIVRRVLAARRSALVEARNAEKLDDEILRELLEAIDLQQAAITRGEKG